LESHREPIEGLPELEDERCPECGQSFPNSQALLEHQSVAHPRPIGAAEHDAPPPPPPPPRGPKGARAELDEPDPPGRSPGGRHRFSRAYEELSDGELSPPPRTYPTVPARSRWRRDPGLQSD
jgi:hypothetical protein